MTYGLAVSPRYVTATLNAGATIVNLDYPVIAAADVMVFRTRAGARSQLALDVDYAVSLLDQLPGARVTLAAPALEGDVIEGIGMRPIQRPSDLLDGNKFSDDVLNAEFDSLIIALQEARRDANRAYKAPFGTTGKAIIQGTTGGLAKWTERGLEDAGIEAAAVAIVAGLAAEVATLATLDTEIAALGPISADIETCAANMSAILAAPTHAANALQAYNDTVAAIAALGNPMVFKGLWDASSGNFPGSGEARAGWHYVVSVAGAVDGQSFDVNDRLTATVNNASATTYANNWFKSETDLVQSVAGLQGVISDSGLRTALGVLQSIDEDNMTSNSDTHVPTQQSAKAYADTKIGGSTGSSDKALLRADGDAGKTAQSALAHLSDGGVLRLGSTSAPHSEVHGVQVGGSNPVTSGISFYSGRVVTVSSAAGEHPFNDENTYNVAGGAAAASFNSAPRVLGGAVDHIAGLQFGASINISGTMNALYGHVDLPSINAGTLTNRFGADIWDIIKAGGAVVTNNYGLRVKELLAGENNWAIYTEGSTPSHFNGPLELGNNLFLAAGAVIDFDGGALTITDSAAALTVAGKQLVNTVAMWSSSAVAPPAGGLPMAYFSASAVSLSIGTGAPTIAAAKGSLYIRTDAITAATRLYINTDGATAWTNFTAAA